MEEKFTATRCVSFQQEYYMGSVIDSIEERHCFRQNDRGS